MWAAGIIMFEIITGRHPIYSSGESRDEVMEKI